MSNQRLTPEFKDEAVRQVIDRYSVADVATMDTPPELVSPANP